MQGAGLGEQVPALLKRVKIWTAKIFAFLATPLGGSPPCWLVFRPAAMPATWLPCWQRFVEPLMQAAVSALAAPVPVWLEPPPGHRLPCPPPPPAFEKQAS